MVVGRWRHVITQMGLGAGRVWLEMGRVVGMVCCSGEKDWWIE